LLVSRAVSAHSRRRTAETAATEYKYRTDSDDHAVGIIPPKPLPGAELAQSKLCSPMHERTKVPRLRWNRVSMDTVVALPNEIGRGFDFDDT
jgi:hypothetical protein